MPTTATTKRTTSFVVLRRASSCRSKKLRMEYYARSVSEEWSIDG